MSERAPVVPINYGGIQMDLQSTALRERVDLVGADDKVIQHTDIHHIQRHLEPMGERFVGLAGLRQARGMIIGANITAAAFTAMAFFTTSLGYTLAPSVVPRNSSANSMIRC